ncbi:MAG: DUF3592 domain-containing protein [Chitinispirillales bacterium]|jgi:hypothetical protein|nr:DUF3592 domain-containing protein [Chitinispirillales bacterium]
MIISIGAYLISLPIAFCFDVVSPVLLKKPITEEINLSLDILYVMAGAFMVWAVQMFIIYFLVKHAKMLMLKTRSETVLGVIKKMERYSDSKGSRGYRVGYAFEYNGESRYKTFTTKIPPKYESGDSVNIMYNNKNEFSSLQSDWAIESKECVKYVAIETALLLAIFAVFVFSALSIPAMMKIYF